MNILDNSILIVDKKYIFTHLGLLVISIVIPHKQPNLEVSWLWLEFFLIPECMREQCQTNTDVTSPGSSWETYTNRVNSGLAALAQRSYLLPLSCEACEF